MTYAESSLTSPTSEASETLAQNERWFISKAILVRKVSRG